MRLKKLIDEIKANTAIESWVGRFRVNGEHICAKYPGNIIEIGAGHGHTTSILAGIASKYKTQVYTIDPFNNDWDNMPKSYRYSYKKFIEDMAHLEKWYTLIKHRSDSPKVLEILKENGPYSLAFIDGIQYEDEVLNDLRTMQILDVPFIAVDDIQRYTDWSQTPQAVERFVKESDYEFIEETKKTKEGWLYDRLRFLQES